MELEESTRFLISLGPGDEGRDGALGLLTGGLRPAPHSLRWPVERRVHVLRDPATTALVIGAATALTIGLTSGNAVEIRPISSAPGWRDRNVELLTS